MSSRGLRGQASITRNMSWWQKSLQTWINIKKGVFPKSRTRFMMLCTYNILMLLHLSASSYREPKTDLHERRQMHSKHTCVSKWLSQGQTDNSVSAEWHCGAAVHSTHSLKPADKCRTNQDAKHDSGNPQNAAPNHKYKQLNTDGEFYVVRHTHGHVSYLAGRDRGGHCSR